MFVALACVAGSLLTIGDLWDATSTQAVDARPPGIFARPRRPTVILFQVGLSCRHCFEQLETLTAKLPLNDINLVVVIPEGPPVDAQVRRFTGVQFVSDLHGRWAKNYGLAQSARDALNLHATVILAADRRVIWKVAGEEPYMDPVEIKRQLANAAE